MPPATITSCFLLLAAGTIFLRTGVLGLVSGRPLVAREMWCIGTGLIVTLAIFLAAVPGTPGWILGVGGAVLLSGAVFAVRGSGLLVMGVRETDLRAHLDAALTTLSYRGSSGSIALPVEMVPRLHSTMPGICGIRMALESPAVTRLARALVAQFAATPVLFQRRPFVLAIFYGLLLKVLAILVVLQRVLWG